MAKKIDHISLKKSTVLDKAPLAKDLVDGELAVNIAKDGEKIFLKNTASEIVEFSSDKLLNKKYLSTTSGGTVSGEATFTNDVKIAYPDSGSTPVSLRKVMADNEEVIAASLNDLNDKINKIGDISIANGVLIINDGNTKYKLNLEQLVTGGYATKE